MEQILGRDKGNMRRFFRMMWKARLPYIWIIGYILISAVISNVGINVTEYTAKLFAGNVEMGTVVIPFLFYTILSLVIGSISGILSSLCSARIDRNFRRMIWGKAVRLPLSFYGKNKPRDLISRITTDVSTISQLIMQVFVSIITTGYTLIITLKKIGSYDHKLMISLIAVLPINILIAYIMGKFQFGIHDIVNKKNAELTGTVSERMNHFLLIKSYRSEEKEYQTGHGKAKQLYKSNILNTWMQISLPMYAIAGMMQFIVIVMVGRGFYADGSLSLTNWIAYYGFGTNIVNILTAYCGYWTSLKNSQGATDRVSRIMEETEEKTDRGETAVSLEGDIVLKDVSFSYGENKVFDDLNLTIPEGRVTAIIGQSGSGKTTLLNLIERLYPVEKGVIMMGQNDISKYSLKSFREKIAYVTQETTMFSGTIMENLMFGVKRQVSKEELETICEKAGILEYINECEAGFDSYVGENGDSLSGGQKQRLALARALLKDTEYLFMDEGTAAMDVRSKDLIWEGISEHMKNRTVIMVAHDRQTVLKADYIIVLSNGRVEAAGEREQIAQTNDYYKELAGKRGALI
jgi:ATP-binding cassette subfamily B protein AbcA/BmrA